MEEVECGKKMKLYHSALFLGEGMVGGRKAKS